MKRSIFVIAFLLISISIYPQNSSVPTLQSFSFTPGTLIISDSDLIVNFSISASGDSVNIDKITVSFSPANGGGNKSETIKKINNVSPSLSGTINFGKKPTEGIWEASISITDVDHNSTSYTSSDLESMHFSSQLEIISESDESAPILTGFSFSPGSIDLANDSPIISFSVSADDDSGLDQVKVSFAPESNGGSKSETLRKLGGVLTASGEIDFGNNPSTGLYRVSLTLTDTEGNSVSYSADQLSAKNYSTDFEITETVDDTPPELVVFALEKDSVDLSVEDPFTNFSFEAFDESGKIDQINIVFSPNENGGSKTIQYKKIDNQSFASTGKVEFNKNSKEGIWNISIDLQDTERNKITISSDDLAGMGFASKVILTSTEDNQPPTLNHFSLSTEEVTLNGDNISITYNFSATDDMSGLKSAVIYLTPETSGGNKTIRLKKVNSFIIEETGEIVFNKNTSPGIWNISIELEDENKNVVELNSSDLEELGFSSQILLISGKFLSLTYPNGGEVINASNAFDIEWEFEGVDKIQIYISSDNGSTWELISDNVNANKQKYKWSPHTVLTDNALIKITDYDDASIFDLSDGTWSIQASITDIADESEINPEYSLEQNYPNPFNPTTNITFSLKESGTVQITIYNLIGQEITQVVNNYYASGTHNIVFDAKELPSGIYYYSIRTNNFLKTRKMILMK